MIPKEKIEELRKELETAVRPLVFFDDDPDGLCSFLQFYKFNPECIGIIYKTAGPLDSKFLRKVEEIQPDKVFILDVPEVDQEFIDGCSMDVFWLDHHAPLNLKKVHYYNPMIESKGKDNRPTSYWAYQVTRKNIWFAMVGCIGDWFIPEDLREDFKKEYPDLLPDDVKKPDQALFSTEVGKLSKVFSFVLKGTTKDAMKGVKTLTRVEAPYEILDKSSSRGKFIWKKFNKINKLYEEIKGSVPEAEDGLIRYIYPENKMALTSDLSNEVLYENPDKFILICRKKNGEHKCSLRSAKHEVLPKLKASLKGLRGHGGGHLHACGANIDSDDFDKFVERLKKQITS